MFSQTPLVLSETLPPTSFVNSKLNTPSDFCLCSVVNHIGAWPTQGHYTAYAHRFGNGANEDSGNGGNGAWWLHCNDTIVSLVDVTTVVEQSKSNCYLAAYANYVC